MRTRSDRYFQYTFAWRATPHAPAPDRVHRPRARATATAATGRASYSTRVQSESKLEAHRSSGVCITNREGKPYRPAPHLGRDGTGSAIWTDPGFFSRYIHTHVTPRVTQALSKSATMVLCQGTTARLGPWGHCTNAGLHQTGFGVASDLTASGPIIP